MFKIFGFFIIFLFYYGVVISQPLSFGFSYGKNFTHACTLIQAATSKEIESHALPKDEYGLLLQYNVVKNNWLILESRLIERQTSYNNYEQSFPISGKYYLKNWELLLRYSEFLFAVENKLSFSFHLLTGYSHLINYDYKKPRKINGIIIGYGLDLSYLAFNQRLKFFINGSLSHLSIYNLYNIDCTFGVSYNLKIKKDKQ